MATRINSHITSMPLFRSSSAENAREALEEAAIAGVDLANADFESGKLDCGDYSKVNLPGAIFRWANCNDSSFAGAILTRVEFDNASFIGCDFRNAILSNARASQSMFAAADFADADLRDTPFVNSSLVDARLKGAKLDGANFDGADLRGIDFSDVDLSGVLFDGAKQDVLEILGYAHRETPELLKRLRAGEFKGQRFRLDQDGLAGTLSAIRGRGEVIERKWNRVGERFARAIQPGMTPKNHALAKIMEGWIVQFLDRGQKRTPAAA